MFAFSNHRNLTKAIVVLLRIAAVLVLAHQEPESQQHLRGTNNDRQLTSLSSCKPNPFAPTSVNAPGSITPTVLCDLLQAFDSLGRNIPVNWDRLCDDFQPLNRLLCPKGPHLEAICSSHMLKDPIYLNDPHWNDPAIVEANYCDPIFATIPNAANCIRSCIRYVSRDSGSAGCCDLKCSR